MPIEYSQLRALREPLHRCPNCGAEPFVSFLRGSVQRSKRWLWIGPKRDYCTVICEQCKEIVGYESPPGWRDDRNPWMKSEMT
jgi:hypothetical protein